MPDGSAFVLENKKTEATTGSMTDANVNGEGLPITSAFKKSIANSDTKNKKQYSLKDHPDEQALIDYESLTEKPDMKIVLLNKVDITNLTFR